MDWWIGDGLANWQQIGGFAMNWLIGDGLAD